jgi:hypothetical protein
MIDEVDILHVKRNTLSGDELLSYIGYEHMRVVFSMFEVSYENLSPNGLVEKIFSSYL